MLAGPDTVLDTTNTENKSEINNKAEERKLQRMDKVHDFLEMWQGSLTYMVHRTKLALTTSK